MTYISLGNEVEAAGRSSQDENDVFTIMSCVYYEITVQVK